MPENSFTCFGKLPLELGLEILEQAFRPTRYHGGIQHLSIKNGTETTNEISPDIPIRHLSEYRVEVLPHAASRWDSGLAVASNLSNEVFQQLTKKIRQDAERAQPRNGPADRLGPLQNGRNPLCLNLEVWHARLRWGSLMNTLGLVMPRSMFLSHHIEGNPLCLEYDPSWTQNWPRNYVEMCSESSQRGFVARMLEDVFERRIPASARIYLIERCTYLEQHHIEWATRMKVPSLWEAEYHRPSTPKVFYDLDMEYLEAQRFPYYEDCEDGTAAHFIGKLFDLGLGRLMGASMVSGFRAQRRATIDPFLRVLTCREFQS